MQRDYRLPIGTIRVHREDYPPPDPNGLTKVIDGDTFAVGGQKWRLFGWDAPPVGNIGTMQSRNHGKHPHCERELELGLAAKRMAEELLADGANRGALHIDILGGPKDQYGRWLVRIKIDGAELGLLLAEHGLAEPFDNTLPKWGFCECEERKRAYEQQLALKRLARDERKQRNRDRKMIG